MVWLNIAVLIASTVAPIVPQLIASMPAGSRDLASLAVMALAVFWNKFSHPSLTVPPVPVALLPTPPPPIAIVKP